MIAQLIHYPNNPNVIGIKILHNSHNIDDLWLSMYDSGFHNMWIYKDDELKILVNPIPKYKYKG